MTSIEFIKNKIRPIADEYNIRNIYLFGSLARNENTDDSDVDLIVDTDGAAIKGLFGLGAFYEDIKDALQMDVDVMTLKSLQEYEADIESQILAENIRKDMVKIYG